MASMVFDKLAYVDSLKQAGVTPDKARAHAEALQGALRDSVATKGDVDALRNDMEVMKRDMTIRMGGMMMALGGVLIAVKFLG